jgi:hypothetical protein
MVDKQQNHIKANDSAALTVRMPQTLYDALKAQADQHERTVAGMLRWLAREHLANAEKSVPPAGTVKDALPT